MTPKGVIDFTYDDRDRLEAIETADFHYTYAYGVANVSGHSSAVSLVQENNQLSAQWTQYLANHHGLPLMFFDSYDWKKQYTYNFSTTPIAPMPISIHHYKKDYGVNSYSAVYNYWAGNQVRTATNNFFSRDQKFEYDANNILSRTFYRQKSGVSGNYPYVDYHFNRDASGLITSITGDKELSANYNPDLEIENVQHTVPQTFDEAYTYDSRGNRLTSLTDSFEYNDLNQLLTASTLTSTLTFTYDADGNMTEEKNTATTETKKFFYNSENRMVRYEHYPTDIEPTDIIAEYKYDIYGRRIQKSVNGAITNFLWEGDNLAYELDLNHQPIRRYVYGIGKDDLKGHVEFSEASSDIFNPAMSGWYSYIKDQVGTINQVYSHQSQAVTDTRTYDVFGKLVNQSGTSIGNMGFQSKYYDAESSLNYYYHRYYNPQVGRFINEDPIGFRGGINFYQFAGHNPLNQIDPFGLQREDIENYDMSTNGYPIPPIQDPTRRIYDLANQTKRAIKSSLKNESEDLIKNLVDLGCWTACYSWCVYRKFMLHGVTDLVIGKCFKLSKKITWLIIKGKKALEVTTKALIISETLLDVVGLKEIYDIIGECLEECSD